MSPGLPGNAIAVIPARGGSKRTPRKNIREFAGKPVIAGSIEAVPASFVQPEDLVAGARAWQAEQQAGQAEQV